MDAARVDDKGNPTPFNITGGGWTQFMSVAPEFYNTFEEGDQRQKTLVSSYYSTKGRWITSTDIGTEWDGYILNKYPQEVNKGWQDTDVPIARWADILLMRAEADVRLHNSVSDEALGHLNEIRHRAGLTKDITTRDINAFEDALIAERGHELMFEGCRKIDLIRFNRYYSTMEKLGRLPSSQYFPLPNYAVQQAEASGYTLSQYFTRDDYDGPKK
jgi:hypothetical protein